MQKLRVNVFTLILFLGFSFFLIMSFRLSGNSGIMPTFICSLGVILTLAQMLIEARKAGAGDESSEVERTPIMKRIIEEIKEVKLLFWILIFMAAIYFFGTLIGIPLFLLLISKLHYKESWLTTILLTVGTTIVYYFLFLKFLEVAPYRGLIGF